MESYVGCLCPPLSPNAAIVTIAALFNKQQVIKKK